jgi:7-carboxy-7-deazaguanine synthase
MLKVSEIFSGLQGEGVSTGIPSVFIRLTGCNINCAFCDTAEVWKTGKEYSVDELVAQVCALMPTAMLSSGRAHVVITGGEPTLATHREELAHFMMALNKVADGCFAEIETNGTLDWDLWRYFNQINCSPKLSNSMEPKARRYNRAVIVQLASMPKTWFKFVIASEKDWEEIEEDFLPLIPTSKIILMPAGIDREELIKNSEMVWNLAMQKGVRASTRLQTITWNNLHGK